MKTEYFDVTFQIFWVTFNLIVFLLAWYKGWKMRIAGQVLDKLIKHPLVLFLLFPSSALDPNPHEGEEKLSYKNCWANGPTVLATALVLHQTQ